MKIRAKSKDIYEKLCSVIPGGVNSPVRSCVAMKQTPLVAERAAEDLIYDVDGNAYIDYCGSWGALIHGHAHPSVLEAAVQRMHKGSSFGVTTPIEGELASKVCALVDSIEKIRFVSSGTEATMSAVRLARGYTSKNIVVKFDGNYHGHADFFLVKAGSGVINLNSSSSSGIPQEAIESTVSLPYNDEKACREFFYGPNKNNIAAVILEPIAANMGVIPATKEFVLFLRKMTEEVGALLIFDEVISGFRVGLQGAQGYYAVKPDLTCFGKIIGGGFPAAAFGGRREIMDHLAPLGPVYQAGTLSGNPVAMDAGLAALKLLENEGFYCDLEVKTNIITKPIEKFLCENTSLPVCLQQVGSMFTLFFGIKNVSNLQEAQRADGEQFAEFFRFLFEHGVYAPPLQWEAWFVSSAHTVDHLEQTRDLILSYLKNMNKVE